MVLRSNTTHVHGDQPAIPTGGVKSGTRENICEPIGHAPEVRAEGSNVIRHLDRFWMNRRNTQGEAIFVRDTGTYEAPQDDDPAPGSLRLAQYAQNAAERHERRGACAEPWNVTAGPTSIRPGSGPMATAADADPSYAKHARVVALWKVGFAAADTDARRRHPAHFPSRARRGLGRADLYGAPTMRSIRSTIATICAFGTGIVANSPGIAPNRRHKKTNSSNKSRDRCRRRIPYGSTGDALSADIRPSTAHVRQWAAACITSCPTWRTGSVRDAATSSTSDRIPNAPTLDQGMSICLTPAQRPNGD